MAAYFGREEVVGALAEGGADLDKANNLGATPLMQAAYHYGNSGVVRRLLELGADHTAVGTGGDYEGKTALELPDQGNEAYDVLLAFKRTEEQVERASGPKAMAMYKALSEEDKAKADEARGRPAAENEQALRDAADSELTAEVRVLLAAGTDPDAAGTGGETALWLAAVNDHEEAVGPLAEGGADLEKADNSGATPRR